MISPNEIIAQKILNILYYYFMKQSINVLLIDDHLIALDAYKNALEGVSHLNDDLEFNVDIAQCCDSAFKVFKSKVENSPYDMVFSDIRLPSSSSKMTSGVELVIQMKRIDPNLKVVIITGHYDAFLFHDILQNTNPDGFLCKSDAGMSIINDVVKSVLEGVPYYSATILKLLRKNISSNIYLSYTDKLLLYEIAKGTKTKDLKKSVPLSQAGIERRKRHLKEVFETKNQNDTALIKSAENKGFL